MKPATFSEQNKELQKPSDMTEAECSPLPIYTDGHICISLWEATWKERIVFLIRGKLWIQVHSGQTQPPIAAGTKYPFKKGE